jgi:hypothetical protein
MGVMIHICNPSTQKTKAGREFKARLDKINKIRQIKNKIQW